MIERFSGLLAQGGYFMVPLLLGSVLAVGVIIERFAYYLRLETGSDAFQERLVGMIRGGKVSEALEWVRTLRGPVAVTAAAALEHAGESEEALEAAMAARARREVPALQRFLPILDTTYSAAPLMGLLGTITGMMGTFRVVAERVAHNAGADTSGVTLGIGEALITTATGILIAVVCLVFHNLFQGWSDSLLNAAETVAAEVVEALGARKEHKP
jgi:biopolymer transport protein ExbB